MIVVRFSLSFEKYKDGILYAKTQLLEMWVCHIYLFICIAVQKSQRTDIILTIALDISLYCTSASLRMCR